MITITLQRNALDIGGNMGVLSIGELPEGVKNESITWVPVATYEIAQGGLAPPSDSLNEVSNIRFIGRSFLTIQTYPLAWEVPLEGIYVNGDMLPASSHVPNNTGLYALIDTVRECASLHSDGFLCQSRATLSFAASRIWSTSSLTSLEAKDFLVTLLEICHSK